MDTKHIAIDVVEFQDTICLHRGSGDWLHVPVDRVVPRKFEPNLVFRKLNPIFEPCQRRRWLMEFRHTTVQADRG